MDYKERKLRENEIRKSWEALRDKRENLIALLKGGKELESFDTVLMYQCLTVVLEHLTLQEDTLKEITEERVVNEIGEDAKLDGFIKSLITTAFQGTTDNIEGLLRSIAGEVENLMTAMNSDAPINKRLDAVENIKLNSWKHLFDRKEEISELSERFPNVDKDDIILIYKCLSVILLELDMIDQEIEILEELWDKSE